MFKNISAVVLGILLFHSVCFAEFKHPSVEACYQFMEMSFEDGSDINQFISLQIIKPLEADPETNGLAKFLDSALIAEGYLDINLDLCRSIEAALK